MPPDKNVRFKDKDYLEISNTYLNWGEKRGTLQKGNNQGKVISTNIFGDFSRIKTEIIYIFISRNAEKNSLIILDVKRYAINLCGNLFG